MSSTSSPKKILIVDDTRENIDLLRGILVDYSKVFALDGAQALTIAMSKNPPDLILLDIMMAGMNGYEVCRRLKEEERTKDIPVVFVTAKTSIKDEAKGLALGAVDYIAKPISPPIVLARVATHLAMRDAYLQLERQYVDLQEMDALRKDVEAITRHDLKSPINGILGCVDLLLHSENLSQDDLKKFHLLVRDSAYQLREMVNLSMDLIKMEQGSYHATLLPTDLLPVIRHILADNQVFMDRKKIKIVILIDGCPEQDEECFFVLGDETLCYTMIANIVKNAIEASEEGQTVTISMDNHTMASITIHNQGEVPEEIKDKFFEKYVTFGKKAGTGLGTYSARLMAETQKGSIHLHSSEEEGTALTIEMKPVTEV